MLRSNETTIWDHRGNPIPLRPDPEGVWKKRGSFRLELGRGYRRYRKHPRVAVVVAIRELQELELRPDTRSGVLWGWVMQSVYALATTAMIYSTFLVGYYGAWNWVAIAITFILLWLFFTVAQVWTWRRSDTKYEQLCKEIDRHPAYCAGCWYPLEGRVEEDGCTVCPECGAAWMVQKMDGTSSQE